MRDSWMLLAGVAAGFSFSAAQGQVGGELLRDRYIVQLKPGASPVLAAQGHGAAPSHFYDAAVNGYAGFIPPGLVARVAADPQVVAVIPDRVVTIYARPGGGGTTSSQVTPAGVSRIGAAPAKGVTIAPGTGVGVAIVDTGIDLGHLDLGSPVDAFSAFGGPAKDDNGHGTHVAGTVAALNNTLDVVGVAPGAKLYAVKVLNAQGSGSDSDIIAGLNWIANNASVVIPNIKVVNISLGRPGSLNDNPAWRTAVQVLTAKGITVVVAAGNDCSLEVSQQVPATYPEVIAVASTTAKTGTSPYTTKIQADTASYFTSDGAFNAATGIGVTVSAPGEDAENILNGGRLSSVGILSTRLGGGTTRMQGTSMASPHVAGVAALLYQKFGSTLSSETVRAKLVAGASNQAAPLASPVSCYTSDGDLEGVVSASGALTAP